MFSLRPLVLITILLSISNSLAGELSFIAKENGKILVKQGDCNTQYPPQSTFKIALSLMGFDSGILRSAHEPVWLPPADFYVKICGDEHNPKTWMRDSCVWYSQLLTKKLGLEKFQEYVTGFAYGNMDVSGGLQQAWLSSSLKISPEEQVGFTQRMVDRQLGVSVDSYNLTKELIYIQELVKGWKLYGKTGNCSRVDAEGKHMDLQHGWFVGYIEKDARVVVFASHIVDSKPEKAFASLRAKSASLIKLWYLIQELE